MQTYLVGGAVRDELLEYPFSEKDWVVVGATAEQLLAQGFQQVGKDFPVFLHPKTHEEYALARTERKQSLGYTGFAIDASPQVTLEQDLLRRDLTINAIAKSADGQLIDPYGGQQDIKNRVLRHVSDAFVEDPLRVLRVARFAARYAHLGFAVAPETMQLMTRLSNAEGELQSLSAERVWRETEKALITQHPEVFIEVLRQCGALKVLFPEIAALWGVPNPAQHHPEIDSGVHTLMVLQQAVKLSNAVDVRFAALTHDLGKAKTPATEWPKHYGHEQAGVAEIQRLCKRCKVPKDVAIVAQQASLWHLHIHRALELKPQTLLKVFDSIDCWRKPERLEKLLLVCEADARGRLGFEQRAYPQRDYVNQAFQLAQQVQARPFVEQGLKGADIGAAVAKQRLAVIAELRQQRDTS
ncbi:multifunctional CCA addition/repair protein [Idiomarina tyrosinivorans]|uniref:Multifunctional CCA protein n=1 Tax=Idiomarina tyrosinivorans TaxID=1445662 RepID=A0A432ZJL5_9GAMM|nr:multifunctional CCA addition/repair protein [Idiomarina tyrosinivorans]RUO78161.1 multifunctional CCA addition/repair protein [Idiomarina tyrosinivorans]